MLDLAAGHAFCANRLLKKSKARPAEVRWRRSIVNRRRARTRRASQSPASPYGQTRSPAARGRYDSGFIPSRPGVVDELLTRQ